MVLYRCIQDLCHYFATRYLTRLISPLISTSSKLFIIILESSYIIFRIIYFVLLFFYLLTFIFLYFLSLDAFTLFSFSLILIRSLLIILFRLLFIVLARLLYTILPELMLIQFLSNLIFLLHLLLIPDLRTAPNLNLLNVPTVLSFLLLLVLTLWLSIVDTILLIIEVAYYLNYSESSGSSFLSPLLDYLLTQPFYIFSLQL